VLLWGSDMKVENLAALGVRRVSSGGALAGAAWAGFDAMAERLAREGRLTSVS
jgi:2-methylisocitrate lyase-like PEP mutase family enzyme